MAENNVRSSGTTKMYKPANGTGAPLLSMPLVGVVKNNVDPSHSGRIDVYIASQCGPDPDNRDNWIKGIKYLSPFHGTASSNYDPKEGADKTGNGKFLGNPSSYGFWASAPDIGTEVVCIFINGNSSQGYYIGCVPQSGLLQMTPGLGASSVVVPNQTEATSYGGADRLPTSEINAANPAIQKSAAPHTEPKPVHSYQASILNAQGLIRDNIRGVISSSAQRESPSRVFGLSTPGSPIFEGGYTSQNIKDAAKTADPAKLKQIGRTGGHTFVMDDGTINGEDQLIRLRSSAGHQITMSDSGQTLFIIHSNGQSWIEMGKEGTVDIYSTNSFNVRTQGDINFHADRDVNINAAKNLNMFGENINIESSKNTNIRTGVNFSTYTMGKYTLKVDGAMSQHSSGQASYLSSSQTFINGSRVNLNSGTASLIPAVVPVIVKTSHIDTTNSPTVGWMNPSPEPLVSVTNRAPAHQPWIGSGKGVDVRIELSPNTSQQAAAPAAAVNSAPATPSAPVTAAQIAAAPAAIASSAGPITPSTAQAIVAQTASSAQQAIATAAPNASAILNPASGITAKIAETANVIKPGASAQVQSLIDQGSSSVKALAGTMTGAMGITSPDKLLSSVAAQASTVGAAISNVTGSLTANGTLSGKESPIQAAGLVMGAVTSGVAAVTDFVKTGVAKVTGLVDSIAGGKFAAGLVDSISGGISKSLSGLVSGVTGKLTDLGNSISGIANSLRTGLENAFTSVEKSFGELKSGAVNVLGKNATPTAEPSANVSASREYDVATAELTAAQDAVFEAKRNYRNDPTPENNAKITAAEANVAAARQSQTQASTSFLKTAVGGAVGGITSSITTTLTSGLNALPGGAGALQSVTNMATGALNSVTGAINSVTSAVTNLGNLASGVASNVTGALSKIPGVSGLMGKLNAGVDGVMAQLNSSLGAIGATVGGLKSAAAAVGTFDKSAIIAKTGQLLGDPKIPSPSIVGSETTTSMTPDTLSSEISSALRAVEDATSRVNAAKLNLALTKRLPFVSDEKIQSVEKMLTTEEDALKSAVYAYTALLS